LEQVNKIKYLGIIFDSEMTFREHVNYVEEKCTKLIFTLLKSAKTTWGAEARGTENNIRRRNTTINFIRSPSVERNYGHCML